MAQPPPQQLLQHLEATAAALGVDLGAEGGDAADVAIRAQIAALRAALGGRKQVVAAERERLAEQDRRELATAGAGGAGAGGGAGGEAVPASALAAAAQHAGSLERGLAAAERLLASDASVASIIGASPGVDLLLEELPKG